MPVLRGAAEDREGTGRQGAPICVRTRYTEVVHGGRRRACASAVRARACHAERGRCRGQVRKGRSHRQEEAPGPDRVSYLEWGPLVDLRHRLTRAAMAAAALLVGGVVAAP